MGKGSEIVSSIISPSQHSQNCSQVCGNQLCYLLTMLTRLISLVLNFLIHKMGLTYTTYFLGLLRILLKLLCIKHLKQPETKYIQLHTILFTYHPIWIAYNCCHLILLAAEQTAWV